MVIGVLGAARQQQVLRVLAVDGDPHRRGLASLDAPVAPLARRVDDGDRLARRRNGEWLIDRGPGAGAWRTDARISTHASAKLIRIRSRSFRVIRCVLRQAGLSGRATG